MIEHIPPQAAWALLQEDPSALLIDVRSQAEYLFAGHPVGAICIPWKDFPEWQLNSRFVEQVKSVAGNLDAPVLLLCRSGQRSAEAAHVLANAGYTKAINVSEGFEGPLDENKQRNAVAGWRYHGLPWEQS
ncbi:MAG: rhodanese-like domain-containing protein [Methylococcales bacterium]|nr:rhodanese-like domain-containing protein [Methylococcales bacterium]